MAPDYGTGGAQLRIGAAKGLTPGLGRRLLLKKQGQGDATGHGRECYKGEANDAEKSGIGGFILCGL